MQISSPIIMMRRYLKFLLAFMALIEIHSIFIEAQTASKAAAGFNKQDCLCQCDSFTTKNKHGKIEGNCKR